MKNKLIIITFGVALISLWNPALVSAHQPRLTSLETTTVSNPEVSKAFYGELTGAPHQYLIQSDKEFRLYVGLLVPNIPGINKDLSIEISKSIPTGNEIIALLDGTNFAWTPFFEEFAHDNYFWGPEFAADESNQNTALKGSTVPAGTYLIKVFSPTNLGKYSLTIGDIEEFPFTEMVNALTLIPQIKIGFFGESIFSVLSSPIIFGYIIFVFALSFIFGLVYRIFLMVFSKNPIRKSYVNIGTPDRLLRLSCSIFVFILAIFTNWHPLLFFFSGFCLFEAIFSWCGLYAALGKKTCP